MLHKVLDFHVLSMFVIRPSIWGRNGAAQGRFYVEWSVIRLCIFLEIMTIF